MGPRAGQSGSIRPYWLRCPRSANTILGVAGSCGKACRLLPGDPKTSRSTFGACHVGRTCPRGGDIRNSSAQKWRETLADFTRTRGRSCTRSPHLPVSQYGHLCFQPKSARVELLSLVTPRTLTHHPGTQSLGEVDGLVQNSATRVPHRNCRTL